MRRYFKKILAWEKADDLVMKIYLLTKKFPKDELYGLTSQLRRAAVSVPANIAEGSGRKTEKDYLNYLYIAKSSLVEVEYYLHLGKRLRYFDENSFLEIMEIQSESARILHGLIKSIEGRLES